MHGNDGVHDAAADVGEDEDIVARLLNTREDPGDGSQAQKEASDG